MTNKFYEPQSIAPILQEGLRTQLPYLSQPKGFSQALPALTQLAGAGLTAATDVNKRRSLLAQQQEYASYLSKVDAGTATEADHVVGRAAGLSLGLQPPDLLGKQLQRSQISENEASSKLKTSTASLYDRNLATPPAPGGPEIITKDGRQFQVVNDPRAPGGKRYQPLSPTADQKPATEGERLTRGFADRAQQAQDELASLTATGYDPAALLSTRGDFVPNVAKNEQDQQAEQAMLNFVSAVLRKESGAAIPIPELAAETRKYFPMRGDKPGVLAQKERARVQAIKNLVSGAGRATSTYEKPKASSPPAPGGASTASDYVRSLGLGPAQ